MKYLHLILLLGLGFTITVQAQDVDDDMYFVSSKKKAKKASSKTSAQNVVPVKVVKPVDSSNNAEADVDYHTGQLRDVDDYNRRGNTASNGQVVAKLVNDTLYVYSNDSTGQQTTYAYGSESEQNENYYGDDNYYEDDYVYTSRLGRYHRVHFIDPWYWDYCYGWYDPWYDPWYGWYAPYYRHGYYSWYDWGWHHSPSWGFGWSYPSYYHHPNHHGGDFAHRPHVTYRNGGRQSNPYANQNNRILNSSYLSRNGHNSLVSRNNMSSRQGGIRNNTDRPINNNRDNRTSISRYRDSNSSISREGNNVVRSERSVSRMENSSRNYNQPSRNTESYRSSTPSRNSSTGGGFSSGSHGGGLGGGSHGGGFSGGGGSRGGVGSHGGRR